MRRSPELQCAYGIAEKPGSNTDWLAVTEQMQERLVREATGSNDNARIGAALWLLRTAHQIWPYDPEITEASCWVRYNRARAGKELVPGVAAPNVPLHLIDQANAEATSVLRVCAGKPTLLVAGSLT